MNLLEFIQKIPKDKSVDIRPHVAEQVRNFIDQNARQARSTHLSPAAYVVNRVCRDTGFVDNSTNRSDAGKIRSSSGKESDYYTNVVNAWAGTNKPKRGKPDLARAVFYWFFRHVSDQSYFMEIARRTWRKDSELFKRFCYAKEGGEPQDSYETILDRFRSSKALSYVARSSNEQKRLSATYPYFINLGPAYQLGRAEFCCAKKLLISRESRSHAVTMAIYGAGGYGKSSLAQELCNDREVQKRFTGGIYWLQFGLIDSSNESAGDVWLSEAIDRMLKRQYPKDERPSLFWNEAESDILPLLEVLAEEPLLLVADDLWTEKQIRWMSKIAGNVSVLATTRRESLAHRAAHAVSIKCLADDASYRMLTHGMPNISPDLEVRFWKVAKGFKGWPLLLNLANGVFKQMNDDPPARIEKSLNEYEQFLADDQIDGWDFEELGEAEIEKRRKLVGFCIEAGLKAIHPNNNPELLRALAVFPDDTDIPFSVVIDLWDRISETSIGMYKGRNRLRRFSDFSFFSSFKDDEDAQLLRLHDEILAYFRASVDSGKLRSLHRKLLVSIQAHCTGGWDTLPQRHTYAWTRLLFHHEKAEQADEANDLRTDFRWLQAKLAAVGALELRRSFSPMPSRRDAQLVGQAVNLSISVLNARPTALAHQLLGRLGHEADARIQKLTQAAQSNTNCWPVPLNPHLPLLGSELLRFVGHSRAVNSAAFDQSGCRIVTASYDGTACVWNAETGAMIGKPLKGHVSGVSSAVFDRSGRKIVTGSFDGTARLWEAETGAAIGKPLRGHDSWVISAAFDWSGRRIVTASRDGTARVWDVETGVSIGRPLEGHDGWVSSAAFDQSGGRIVTTSSNVARLWDAKSGAMIGKPLEGHKGLVNSAAFDQSGSRIVTASRDGTARIWNADTGDPIGNPLKGHNRGVNSAAFDPSGQKIVTASSDSTVRLWDAETGLPLGIPLSGHDSSVNCAVFDRSGCKIVTASSDETARLWDAETIVSISKPLGAPYDRIFSADFDPTGRKVVIASFDSTARLCDAETGAVIGKPLKGHNDKINSVQFDPTGRRVVTASRDGTVRLWDAYTGDPVGTPLKELHDQRFSAALDPNDLRIVTVSSDGTAQLWDAETGDPIGKPLEGKHDWLCGATFDLSGRKFVTASNRTVHLWDAGTGAAIGAPLKGHEDQVCRAAFDQSGHKIVTASFDCTARLWDCETGVAIGRPLAGHHKWVFRAVFDPSGRKVVTASHDQTVRLWDAETSICLATIDFDHTPESIVWNAKHIAVRLRSGLISLFKVDSVS